MTIHFLSHTDQGMPRRHPYGCQPSHKGSATRLSIRLDGDRVLLVTDTLSVTLECQGRRHPSRRPDGPARGRSSDRDERAGIRTYVCGAQLLHKYSNSASTITGRAASADVIWPPHSRQKT